MDFNIFLARFGLSPDNFVNKLNEPIPFERGFIYEIEEQKRNCSSPCCHEKAYINNYKTIEYNCSNIEYIDDVIRIKRIRYRCSKCGKTFTLKLDGIPRNAKVTRQNLLLMFQDFKKSIPFSDIASKYKISTMRAIQIFNENFPYINRLPMPEILCIDEIYFKDQVLRTKYSCILYDYKKRNIVDMIVSRQKGILDEYFLSISPKELHNVKFFVSDMYDAYASIRAKFFPNAIHIVDIFHVIRLLTVAVNQLRVRAMNTKIEKGSLHYKFMSSHYKLFLCRHENIPNKFYTLKSTGEIFHYDDLVFDCLKIDSYLTIGYSVLQDLFHYSNMHTYTEALNFIEFIYGRLIECGNELLEKVGKSYKKWRFEIASAFSSAYKGTRITNSIAENTNNRIKTLYKVGYGYRNFQTFRNRIMYILNK